MLILLIRSGNEDERMLILLIRSGNEDERILILLILKPPLVLTVEGNPLE